MIDRDCEHCARNIGGHGCTSWDCEYINSYDAIEAYKELQRIKREDRHEHRQHDQGAEN